MKHPDLQPIKSSLFKSFGYDPATRHLHLEFHNGDVWRYDDVPAERAATMQEAASPGAYFGSRIKGQYTRKKVS